MRGFAKLAALAAGTVFALLLVIDTGCAVSGASNALTLCAQVLIPTLFPFMVISSFIADIGLPDSVTKALNPFMQAVFRLPASALTAILLALVGGYPVGARMTRELMERGSITVDEAKRMMLFCVCAGPSFVIGAVGSHMLGDYRAGLLLFASLIASAAVTAVLSRFVTDSSCSDAAQPPLCRDRSLSQSFSFAVSQSSAAMLCVCAWVIFFGSVLALAASHIPQGRGLTALMCIVEVTNGCRAAAGALPLPVIAAVLGFGGLCVHCQIFSLFPQAGGNMPLYLCARMVNAVFAAFFCNGLLRLFPIDINVAAYAGETVVRAWSVSAPAAGALMFLCALVILELDTGEKV